MLLTEFHAYYCENFLPDFPGKLSTSSSEPVEQTCYLHKNNSSVIQTNASKAISGLVELYELKTICPANNG